MKLALPLLLIAASGPARALRPPSTQHERPLRLQLRPRLAPPGPACPARRPARRPLAATPRQQQAAEFQLTLPDKLTLLRVAMVPLLLVVWCWWPIGWPWQRAMRAGLFVLAAITDWLDGFLARRMNATSAFGAFLDPVADKLMVATTLCLLTSEWGVVVGVPSALIVSREIAVSALREWMAELGERGVVAVSFAGKLKTATQLVALSVMLAVPPPLPPSALLSGGGAATTAHLAQLGLGALYMATVFTVSSGWNYAHAALPFLLAPPTPAQNE